MHIRPHAEPDETAVIALWRVCDLVRPWNDPRKDIARKGIAAQMMARLEELLRACGCPKINLQVRNTNAAALGFYERRGYLRGENVSLGKRLIPDD